MAPKHQPPDIRRAQILEAAAAVWAEKGYHATRIDDIAERAGLSKGAVYHHFDSKVDVFTALAEKMTDELTAMVDAAVAARMSVADALAMLVQASEAMVSSEAMLPGFFELYVLSLHEESLRTRMRTGYEAAIVAVTRLLELGVETGELRPGAPAAATALMAALDGIFLVSPLFDEPGFIARHMRAWVDLALQGLLARPKGDRP